MSAAPGLLAVTMGCRPVRALVCVCLLGSVLVWSCEHHVSETGARISSHVSKGDNLCTPVRVSVTVT